VKIIIINGIGGVGKDINPRRRAVGKEILRHAQVPPDVTVPDGIARSGEHPEGNDGGQHDGEGKDPGERAA